MQIAGASLLIWLGAAMACASLLAVTLAIDAFAQSEPPATPTPNDPIPGQHGDHTVGTVSADGRTLSMSWRSAGAERMAAGPDGPWVPYLITQNPTTGTVHFSSAHLNATLHKQDCTLRTPDNGGRVIHRLMTAPPIGPWSVHEASYLECNITVDDDAGRVTVAASGTRGLDWLTHYNFSADGTELEWTYDLSVDGAEAAGRYYGFRTHMIGAPVQVNGTAASVGSAYQRHEATALPLSWGDLVFDLKDPAHNATSSVSVVGPTANVGGIDLPRKHPHRTAPQLVSDFMHGAEMLEVGDRHTVDPSVSLTPPWGFHMRHIFNQALSPTACLAPAHGDPLFSSSFELAHTGAHGVGIGGFTGGATRYQCYITMFPFQLPLHADGEVDGAALAFTRGPQSMTDLHTNQVVQALPHELTWIYYGRHYTNPHANDLITILPELNAATSDLPAAAAPSGNGDPAPIPARDAVNQSALPILSAITPPTGAGASVVMAASPEAARYFLSPDLRTGQNTANILAWRSASGQNLDASQQMFYGALLNSARLHLNYSITLYPIGGIHIDSIQTRPSVLNTLEGSPPYQRLEIHVVRPPGPRSDLAPDPSDVELRVREAGSTGAWLRVDPYNDDPFRPSTVTGNVTLYADQTLDPWPDGGHNLHGRGPFEWQARLLYSHAGDNDLAGPWVAANNTAVALCGAAPGPVLNLAAARFSETSPALRFTWDPPRAAPPDQCGPLNYNLRAIDEGQTVQYLRVANFAHTAYAHTFPAFDRVRFYVQANSTYGTSAEVEVSAVSPAHGHRQVLSFTTGPLSAGTDPRNPAIHRETAGSVSFAWTLNETATTDPGILAPDRFVISYLRTSPSDGGLPTWQTLNIWPPDARAGLFNYSAATPNERLRLFGAAGGGFLPQVAYNLSLRPEYSDGFYGPTLYAPFAGPIDRITASTVAQEYNATSGHTLSNVLRASASVIDMIEAPSVTYDIPAADGIQWTARYTEVDSDLNRVDRTIDAWASAAFPNTTAIIDCAPDSKGDDPCEFLRANRPDISARSITAYLYEGANPVTGRLDYAEYDVQNLPTPCVIEIPAPTSASLTFEFLPGPNAPASADQIGDLVAAWNAVPAVPVGSIDCTYAVASYDLSITGAKAGTTIPQQDWNSITSTSHRIAGVPSLAEYTAVIRARGLHGLQGAAATVSADTPPWPAQDFALNIYPYEGFTTTGVPPGPLRHLVIPSWNPPPHLPSDAAIGDLSFLVDGFYNEAAPRTITPSARTGGLTGPFSTNSPFTPPAFWSCYSVTACYDRAPIDGACSTYAGGSPSACGEPYYLPDAVTDLTGVATVGAVQLSWQAPRANSALGIRDYQINWTSPFGEPNQPVAKAPGNATTYLVTHLPLQTGSSLRVAADNIHSLRLQERNITGAAILNVRPSLDFTPGNIDLANETRGLPPLDPHITFASNRSGSDAMITATWPAALAGTIDCTITIPTTNNTYSRSLAPPVPLNPDDRPGATYQATVTLVGIGARNAEIDCAGDAASADVGLPGYAKDAKKLKGHYSLSADPAGIDLPFVAWIQSFREGEVLSTSANIGVFDIVTLSIIIISMIGFQRTNPGIGLLMSIIILGVAAYFGLIQMEGVVMGILALLVMLAVGLTRRSRDPVE